MTNEKKSKTSDELHPTLAEAYLGVWRIVYTRGAFSIPGKGIIDEGKKAYEYTQAYIIPFLSDIRRILGTKFFVLYLFHHFWWGIEGALLLYLLSGLLHQIETTYANGTTDEWAIGSTLSIRLLCVVLMATIRWIHEIFAPIMRTRTRLYFQRMLMETHLRLDLDTYSDATNRPDVQATQAWYVFTELMEVFNAIFSFVSHLAMISDVARGEQGGLFFAVLCVAKPIFTATFARNLYATSFILYAINETYLRSVALNSLATEKHYKQEVLSGALESYIKNEFEKTQVALGGTSDEFPSQQFSNNVTPFQDIIGGLLGDLPLIYYALIAIMYPGRMSVTSLAMLQQTASSLRDIFDRISQKKSSLYENLHHIESLYNGQKVKNTTPDGRLPYPPPEEKEAATKKGMAISVRNVSFKYPGSLESRMALRNVSFDLPASSLVVIVGSNGSGKSSLVKLLANLHHPTSGTILIDGKPSTEYRSQDLRQATALLTQDHLLFPFTISENIAVGDPECSDEPDRMDRVRKAAERGGATEVINKLDHGFDEMTSRAQSVYYSQYPLPPGPLKDIVDKVEKYTNFSGGETQRLVASRTFMRISSGKMKLVVADEPTSAMDPEGEFELFQTLRQVREGMTMIFITHRFGHLTKHADLILCLKDGEIVESGTHRELLAKEGEYRKLYNIQASAFMEDLVDSTPSSTPSENGQIPNGDAESKESESDSWELED